VKFSFTFPPVFGGVLNAYPSRRGTACRKSVKGRILWELKKQYLRKLKIGSFIKKSDCGCPPSRSTGRGTPENMIIVARAIGIEGFGGQRAFAMSDKIEGWGMPM
jgi:hypothetical protein